MPSLHTLAPSAHVQSMQWTLRHCRSPHCAHHANVRFRCGLWMSRDRALSREEESDLPCDPTPRQAKIRAATLRWHPDKFCTTFQPLCRPAAWAAVSETATRLSEAALAMRRQE
jgi:hypothetical protein